MYAKKLKTPKVFISYSQSSQDHENWVLNLAKKLRDDGIDIIIDKWDLGIGHDKYAFMERMVTDEEISKVIIISDKKYMEKADSRKGGVGTESQIFSREIYEEIRQSKFIPVVIEFDKNFSPCLPVFLKTRKYIDLSSPEAFDENYSLLLRCLYDLPIYRKPDIGIPPKYIIESIKTSSDITEKQIFKTLKTGKVIDRSKDKKKLTSLNFEIINEIIDDVPIKTQIQQDIIVSGNVTKENLQSLLLKQYKSLAKRSGFKYHDKFTNIYIYLYDKEKKVKAGQGLWLAMLQLSLYDKNKPEISIREEQISRFGRKSQEKFGLKETTRELIFSKIVLSEDMAMDKAMKLHPTDIHKHAELEEKLRHKYLRNIGKEYSLSEDQIKQISVEGLENQWIMPSTINEVVFPKKRTWDTTGFAIAFPAEVDGRKIPCAISMEALEDHFKADSSNPLSSFDNNRSIIESITENIIRLERFEPDGTILIRTIDIYY